MTIADLRTEYRTNPLGLASTTPRFSWRLATDRPGARQTAYRVQVASTVEGLETPDLWDSGTVASDASLHVVYAGAPLPSRQRGYWKVTVTDETGAAVTSETAYFEMGLLAPTDWNAGWIGANLAGGPQTTAPSPYLRYGFTLDRPLRDARLYATALGVYEASLNGKRVGEDVLSPGWTDYHKRVPYQTYDVTDLLQAGENVIGAVLGDGWYCGHIGWHHRQFYGDRPMVFAQLVVTFEDGTEQTIATGPEWQFAFGPLLESDLLMGESYDARRELPGWNTPGYSVGNDWQNVTVFPAPPIELVPQQGPTVRVTEELRPIGIQEFGGWPGATYVIDLGQNMVGRIRLKLKGNAGDTVRIRYAETLKGGPATTTGPIYTDNLRAARQTDYYTLKGDPDGEVYESCFTFHGFRFVELYGYPGKPTTDDVVGVVLHSEIPKTGDFECSDPLINQLQKNIDWGQRGNYLEVPTDCPQRDERLGWTGDAQVFVRTAAFNRDIAGFFTKWMQDMRDAQPETGEFPPFAPNVNLVHSDGGPAWADAGVICPWTIYRCYGDTRILEENYAAMKRFVDFQATTARDYLRCYEGYNGFHGFGDWLALDGSGKTEGGTPKELIGTAFFAYSASLLCRIALLLDHREDALRYGDLYEKVKAAFIARYVTPAGKVYPGTQTAYVLALHFNLLPDDLRQSALEDLARDIKSRGNKMSTGFVGSSYLPHVLSENGKLDLGYTLLHQKQWPSFLYAVTQGATTIWERWDGWTHDKGFQDAGMNSFNHYAYGAIGSWLYQVVAGIDLDPVVPGYKKFVLRPRPHTSLEYARAYLDTLYGRIESGWKYIESGGWEWDVTVPANTTATAFVPTASADAAVQVQGDRAEPQKTEDGKPAYLLLPGRYRFMVG